MNLIIKQCPICKTEFTIPPGKSYERTFCSKECSVKDQKTGFKYSKKTPGGYRRGSGRGKSGWYKGYWCDSTYELVFVIYNIDHNISFKRNTQGFTYSYNDQFLNYYPDFILNDTYIEIKGFLKPGDSEKHNQFPYRLKILYLSDLRKEFEYVIERYGPDFYELYDGNPHNKKLKRCIICGNPAKNYFCSRLCAGKGNHVFKQKNGTPEENRTPLFRMKT